MADLFALVKIPKPQEEVLKILEPRGTVFNGDFGDIQTHRLEEDLLACHEDVGSWMTVFRDDAESVDSVICLDGFFAHGLACEKQRWLGDAVVASDLTKVLRPGDSVGALLVLEGVLVDPEAQLSRELEERRCCDGSGHGSRVHGALQMK